MAGLLGFLPHRDRHLRARRGSLAWLQEVHSMVEDTPHSAGLPMDVVEGGDVNRELHQQHPGLRRRGVGRSLGHGPTTGLSRHVPGLGAGVRDTSKVDQARRTPTRAMEEPAEQHGQQGKGNRRAFNTELAGHTFHENHGTGRDFNQQVDFSEGELLTMEGVREGVEGHAVVGDQEAQHKGQLAAVRFGADKREVCPGEDRDAEGFGLNEEWGEEKFDFSFPPVPPMEVLSRGSESSGGLLHLVKRRRTSKEKPEREERLKASGSQGRRGLHRERGGRGEGKGSGMKEKRRRKDTPKEQERTKRVKKNEKWKKAIQTARIFRLNRPQRDKSLQDFKEGYYANSSRRAKASVRKTVNKILLNLGTKGTAEQWSEETLERVGAVLKKADYKAGVTYLSEYKQMLIEAGKTWSHRLQRTFGQVARALKRARGPVKKAAEVEEVEWMEACKIETNEELKGPVHRPALMFGFATVWMLREVELAAVHKEDIVINEKEKTVALTLRLTKCDQEAKGLKRTLQCCCPEECNWSEPCPLAISKAALDNVPIEEDHLVHGDSEGIIEKNQIIGAWRNLFGQNISGHSARRSGALQYIRRGWHVPQVAFLGRWKSDVILQYAEEALETMPVMNKAINLAGMNPGRGGNERVVEKLVVTKGEEQGKETEKRLKKELDRLKDKQDQLDASILKCEEISNNHQGLLPPVILSKSGTVHENKKQPVASPVTSWHTKCGWFYGASVFTFGMDVTKVNCLKCTSSAQSTEERFGRGGA